MRTILTFAAAMALAALAWGAETTTAPSKKKTPAKKPGTVSAAKKAPATSTAAKKTVAARKPSSATATATAKRSKKGPPVSNTTWRNRQTAPTPDRYKEIQDALVAKGYLPQEEANGAWGQASADALKKFQAEQTLESTGKINSLSLIALGLGPKHDSLPAKTADTSPAPESNGHN